MPRPGSRVARRRVAGFIAGSSLPLQAAYQTGVSRWVHERGRVLALGFVVAATGFSLSMQALTIGQSVAAVAATFVTTALAVPMLIAAAAWEVWIAPRLVAAVF